MKKNWPVIGASVVIVIGTVGAIAITTAPRQGQDDRREVVNERFYDAVAEYSPKALDYGGEGMAFLFGQWVCDDWHRGLSESESINRLVGSLSNFSAWDAKSFYATTLGTGFCVEYGD